MITKLFPFLGWFKNYNITTFRFDLVAGLTVALVLIPQSMAYAQLAGLPAYYGLYAAFLPPMIAALFGSSRQLATGPVAVVSLMTAAALEPLATAGSESFIAYAVMLALVVGVFQLCLGLLKLGLIVNFLSHPVVNGFTNAAAIIIATSQLSKLFGVYVDKADHHYETIYRVLEAATHYVHWASLWLAMLAFVIMYGLKKLNPKIPFVLLAVIITTLISKHTNFEHNEIVSLGSVAAEKVRRDILQFNKELDDVEELSNERNLLNKELDKAKKLHGESSYDYLSLLHEGNTLNLKINTVKNEVQLIRKELRSLHFRAVNNEGRPTFYIDGDVPGNSNHDNRNWRIRVGNNKININAILFMGGGDVVGTIPAGLPSIGIPKIDYGLLFRFLPVAAIISLLGFMEAISIAKAMAAKTKQRLDPNQELIGQGIANIVGSFSLSYPVSGSFSRSAVNIGAGAVSGLSSVITSIVVLLALLFFTPLLYHIPQSVLAAVIMMAVVGLINIKGFIHAYRAQKYDGVIAVISFIFTLSFAPHLDKGILIGVILSLGHYLFRNTKPEIAVLSRHEDKSLRDAKRHNLKECKYISIIRFEGPLFFASTSFLEDEINKRIQKMPDLHYILLAANGINEIDASGEETLSLIVERVRGQGIEFGVSSLNENALALIKRTHLFEKIGEENIFTTRKYALEAIHKRAHEYSDEKECPLMTVCRR